MAALLRYPPSLINQEANSIAPTIGEAENERQQPEVWHHFLEASIDFKEPDKSDDKIEQEAIMSFYEFKFNSAIDLLLEDRPSERERWIFKLVTEMRHLQKDLIQGVKDFRFQTGEGPYWNPPDPQYSEGTINQRGIDHLIATLTSMSNLKDQVTQFIELQRNRNKRRKLSASVLWLFKMCEASHRTLQLLLQIID